ncbi:hypothetical protein RS130_02265 [Paraglaciecola aquimarina]|uniref:Uncharacterized protein n=1 Tax=Paraglaciecola aquimarina TaxID=1235557 RepID=A0ABU3SSA6_9ALTE|nr:hypothetical protein [Paraglaciecola aquimarina]MDU0352901.1 hypothetical protein [Paraglaciecola aquimarina]
MKTQAPPTQPEEQPPLPKPAPSLKPNRISTELEPIEVVASHPNPTPIPTQQEIKPQTKDKPVTAPPQVPRVEEQIATPVEPTSSTVINSQFTGTAGKHVQALNQQKDAQMAREAREYYQQQKNSPTLDTTNRNRFASEDEKLLDKTKVRANCDGITRKTASVLLGIMGARIDCTSKPDINTYINKHVNKEELLDAKYKQSQHKHPRSIVIQDPPNQDTHQDPPNQDTHD